MFHVKLTMIIDIEIPAELISLLYIVRFSMYVHIKILVLYAIGHEKITHILHDCVIKINIGDLWRVT